MKMFLNKYISVENGVIVVVILLALKLVLRRSWLFGWLNTCAGLKDDQGSPGEQASTSESR